MNTNSSTHFPILEISIHRVFFQRWMRRRGGGRGGGATH